MKKIAMFALPAAAALMTLSVHAAWTLNDAETSATYAAVKKIPDYRKVRKAIVGFIGDVVLKNGEFVSVKAQTPHREFTESGNGPCWVIDADWKPKGFSVIVR